MSEPTLTHTGQRLYDAVAPLATEDEANGWALAHLCAAFASMIDELADITRDGEDGTPGWAPLFDLETVDPKWLPWLAQFVGVQLPENLSVDAQILRIRSTDGFRRGTPDAIKGAAQQHLTGTKKVYLEE